MKLWLFMKFLSLVFLSASLLISCQTQAPGTKPSTTDTTRYPQPFDPEFRKAAEETAPLPPPATFDQDTAKQLLFAKDHSNIYAEPITPQLAQQYPHLKSAVGQILLGSSSLQFVFAGVTTTQQAKGMLPLLTNTYYRTVRGWQSSATTGRIDWKIGKAKETIWPVIGIDADHGSNYAALSLTASPSIKSSLRVKTLVVFIPELQSVYLTSQMEHPEKSPTDVLLTLRQHGFNGGTELSQGNSWLTMSRMLNDDFTLLQAWPKQIQPRTQDLFLATDLNSSNQTFSWSLGWGNDTLQAGVMPNESRKYCIEQNTGKFFSSTANHSELAESLKSCLTQDSKSVAVAKAENEELGFPIPRLLQLKSGEGAEEVHLSVPLQAGQEFKFRYNDAQKWQWRDGTSHEPWQELNESGMRLTKRPGGLVRMTKTSPPTFVQLNAVPGAEFLDISRALQTFLDHSNSGAQGSFLYLANALQFHLPYGSYQGRMVGAKGRKECPVTFALGSDKPEVVLECSEPQAIPHAPQDNNLVTVDLSSRVAEKTDLLKFASHGVSYHTEDVDTAPEQVAPTTYLTIAVTDPSTQLSARLFPLSLEEVKRWRNLRQQRGNPLLKLAEFQRNLGGKTWLTLGCPTAYLDQDNLIHWLKQLTPAALEVAGCNSTAVERSLSQAAFQYLASSTHNLYLLGRSGFATADASATPTPNFLFVFGAKLQDQSEVWDEIYQGHFYQSSLGFWRSISPTLKAKDRQSDELTFELNLALPETSANNLKFELNTDGGTLDAKDVAIQDKSILVTFLVPKRVRFGQLQWKDQNKNQLAQSTGISSNGSATATISGQFATLDLNKLREQGGK